MFFVRELKSDEKTRTLLEGYLTKAEGKLRAAQVLLRSRNYDDAVSRAYYAAFHAAQAVLLTEGLTVETHQGLVNLFGLHFVKVGKIDRKFGKFLANLKDDRENGDYEIYSAIDEASSRLALKEAKEFVQAMKSYLKKFTA